MPKLDSVLKSRDITLLTKVHIVKAMVSPDLHIDFSRGRSGGLVFPSLEEFSTAYCDPQGQRLLHSQ